MKEGSCAGNFFQTDFAKPPQGIIQIFCLYLPREEETETGIAKKSNVRGVGIAPCSQSMRATSS